MDTTVEPEEDPGSESPELVVEDARSPGEAARLESPFSETGDSEQSTEGGGDPLDGRGGDGLAVEEPVAEEILPSPGREDFGARLERLEGRLDERFEMLLGELKARWALDRFREEQVDTLHAELQEHKRDLLGRALQPIFQGLIRLHGDLQKTVEALRDKDPEELTVERFFGVMAGFHEDMELLLERHGVTKFEQDGDVFEPARQTALRTEPAPRADLTGRILARIRPGFEQGDILLRKEGVAVWASPPDAPAEHETPGTVPDGARPNEMEEPK